MAGMTPEPLVLVAELATTVQFGDNQGVSPREGVSSVRLCSWIPNNQVLVLEFKAVKSPKGAFQDLREPCSLGLPSALIESSALIYVCQWGGGKDGILVPGMQLVSSLPRVSKY